MNRIVYPGRLEGSVRVPPSKSAAHRALIAAALSDGPCVILLPALNRDIEATIACLSALGAAFEWSGASCRVTPVSRVPAGATLDCGESGSTLRFLLPVACALGADARFVGHGRLPERPNAVLADALRSHGAGIDSDRLPMRAQGPILPGTYELPGNVSSQYVTGLLFALPLLDGDSEIALTSRLESAAYVDMTLGALARFGIRVEATERGWRVPGGQRYHAPGKLEIEGDWSAAAFWLAANRMGSRIALEGLSDRTAQGDRAILELLGKPEIDASGVPDLVPILAATAATLPQRTVITGAARLRLKESDRLAATANLINCLGGQCAVTEDGLVIDGGRPLHGGRVDGCNDHRIVMSAAILALSASGPVTIMDAGAVEKSYPDFFDDFIRLGGKAHVEHPGT